MGSGKLLQIQRYWLQSLLDSWNAEGNDFRERLVGALQFRAILLYCVERKLGKKT